jgi:hypothetical protein
MQECMMICTEENACTSIHQIQAAKRDVHNNVVDSPEQLYPYHLQQVQVLCTLDFRPFQKFASDSFDGEVKISSLAAMYSSLMKQASQGEAQ